MKLLNELRWIPCSERLPNTEEWLKNDGRFIVSDGKRSYQSHYDAYKKVFGVSVNECGQRPMFIIDRDVIAWQPMPEHYEEQEGQCGMSKAEILDYFYDINAAYNDCSRHDSLSNMLDEFEQEIRAKAIDVVFDYLKIKRDKRDMKICLDDLEIRKYKEYIKGGD